jgi:hypothetical protein
MSYTFFKKEFVMTKLVCLAFCCFSFSELAIAQTGYSTVFPQFADGRFSDGSFYKSTLVKSSDTINNLSCAFWSIGLSSQRFTNGAGQVFVPDSAGRLGFSLPSLRSQVFQSAGTSALSTGLLASAVAVQNGMPLSSSAFTIPPA